MAIHVHVCWVYTEFNFVPSCSGGASIVLATEKCDDYYMGQKGRWAVCPNYCCGSLFYRTCCSNCFQAYPTRSCDSPPTTRSFSLVLYALHYHTNTIANTILFENTLNCSKIWFVKLTVQWQRKYIRFFILVIKLCHPILVKLYLCQKFIFVSWIKQHRLLTQVLSFS